MYCLSQASKGSTFTRVNASVNGSVNRNVKLLCFRSYRSRPSSNSSSPPSSTPPPSNSYSSNSPLHKFRNKSSSKSSPKSNTSLDSPSFSPSPSQSSSPPTSSSTLPPDFIAQEIKELGKRGDFISVADVYKLLTVGKELTPKQAEEIICIVKPHKTIAPLLYVAYIKACARHGDLKRVEEAAKLCGVNVRDWASETIEGKRGIESIERVMRVKALAVKGDTVDVLLEAARALKLSNSHKVDIFTEVISHFTITKGTMEGLEVVLKEMKNENVTMNEHGFRRYLRIHVLARDYHACLREFHKLRDNGLLVGDTGVSELITLFGSSDFGGITDLYLSEFVHPGKQPPREVYEALIKFYFHRRDNATVVRLFKEAIQTVNVSAEAFLQAFNSCAWLNPADLPELRTYISSHYWMVDTHVFNSMLETYSSKAMLDECLDLFNEMQLTVHGPNVVTYNILINHFGRTKHVDAMLALFRTMQNCNIEPDAATYAHLIFWHSQAGASSSACELLTEALSKNISISLSTFGAFADMCLSQGDEETCKKFTQQMVDNGMGEVAYKALLGKYSREGNTKKATFILNELEKHGMAVTPEIHGVMLKNIISSGDYKRCQQFVADLDSKGIRLSGRMYSELLKFYAHHDINLCVGVLQKMKEWKLTPELQAYEAILTVLLKSQKFQECINVFESMKLIHLQPSTSAYNLAMSAAGKMGDLAYCSKLLEEMRKSGPFPDRFTYNTIMSHSSRARDVSLLEKLREQMKQDGIPLTVVVYGILINSASRSFDVEGALKLYEEMKENRILPDAVIFHDLMLLLLRANDHKMVMKIYSEMRENGFVPQLRLYTVLLRHLAAMKDYSSCKDLMEEMLSNGVEPDAKLLSIMKKVAKEEENEQQVTVDNITEDEKGVVDEDGLKDNVILCTTENEKGTEDEKKDDVNKDVQIFFKMCIT